MKNNEFCNKWVCCDITCCSPCIVVNESISAPSDDVVSSDHYNLDLALKLPNIIVKDGWSCLTKWRSFSRYDKNSNVVWLGDQ